MISLMAQPGEDDHDLYENMQLLEGSLSHVFRKSKDHYLDMNPCWHYYKSLTERCHEWMLFNGSRWDPPAKVGSLLGT